MSMFFIAIRNKKKCCGTFERSRLVAFKKNVIKGGMSLKSDPVELELILRLFLIC